MNEKPELSKAQLARTLNDAGYKHVLVDLSSNSQDLKKNSPVIKGELCFNTLPSGMKVHCTDVIEEQSGKTTSEINECISINFLLKGKVEYSLDNNRFMFSADEKPLAFVSCIGEKQLFTRYFNQGEHIRKLNISVDQNWLLSRCVNEEDLLIATKMFSLKQAVYRWECSQETLELVERLFEYHHNNSLLANLKAEQIASQLFSIYYQQVDLVSSDNAITPTSSCNNNVYEDAYFEKQLEAIIYQPLSLAQISTHLGASISSLQRYFKAKHQLTLKEYIRNQKLEHARRSLVFDKQSIGEVAYIAGYKHASNFSTAFKKYFNVTPAELQSQYN